jgi:hypothetical protein
MNDQFNSNTEKRHPPPYLTGHEVYEMVKDVHVVLGKWKRTRKFTEECDMWKKQLIFWSNRIVLCVYVCCSRMQPTTRMLMRGIKWEMCV